MDTTFGSHLGLLPPLPKSSRDDGYSSDSSTNEEVELQDKMYLLVVMALNLYITMLNYFEPIELSRENQVSITSNLPVRDLLE